jgi:hypothetical protein
VPTYCVGVLVPSYQRVMHLGNALGQRVREFGLTVFRLAAEAK